MAAKRKKKPPKHLRDRAEQRAALLWDHYNEAGILYRADVERLTGIQFGGIYRTFETYGLNAPPVYDSRAEIYRRKAKRLQDEAHRLGQEHLTIGQVARLLEIKPSDVTGLERRLKSAGLNLPDIVPDPEKTDTPLVESREICEWSGRLNGVCNPLYHPRGLPVLDWWPGPGENEVTYLLR